MNPLPPLAGTRNANNLPVLTFMRGNDLSGSLQGAGGIGGILAMTENNAVNPVSSYFHADGNGNVTMLISTNQIAVAQASYDPSLSSGLGGGG